LSLTIQSRKGCFRYDWAGQEYWELWAGAVGLCPGNVKNSIDNGPVNFLGSSLFWGVGELCVVNGRWSGQKPETIGGGWYCGRADRGMTAWRTCLGWQVIKYWSLLVNWNHAWWPGWFVHHKDYGRKRILI
jgi:hypothetical protein